MLQTNLRRVLNANVTFNAFFVRISHKARDTLPHWHLPKIKSVFISVEFGEFFLYRTLYKSTYLLYFYFSLKNSTLFLKFYRGYPPILPKILNWKQNISEIVTTLILYDTPCKQTSIRPPISNDNMEYRSFLSKNSEHLMSGLYLWCWVYYDFSCIFPKKPGNTSTSSIILNSTSHGMVWKTQLESFL